MNKMQREVIERQLYKESVRLREKNKKIAKLLAERDAAEMALKEAEKPVKAKLAILYNKSQELSNKISELQRHLNYGDWKKPLKDKYNESDTEYTKLCIKFNEKRDEAIQMVLDRLILEKTVDMKEVFKMFHEAINEISQD